MLYRHGDVLVQRTDEAIPADAEKQPHTTLAHGEITGHRHRIAEPDAAALFVKGNVMFLKVIAPQATLVHEEHRDIVLPRGTYRVWIQREYSPQAVRRVTD